MKKLFLSLLILTVPSFAQAETTKVTVKGMVCSFCAQGIKKNFSKIASVSKVDADLEKKLITVETKGTGDLSDDQISSVITDSGYEVVGIEREN